MTYIKSNKTFQYKHLILNYCIDSHNTRGSVTERVVEIPLLYHALNTIDNPIEIGCVSPYYFTTSHKVYDLTDTHPACCKMNAKDIDIKNKNIISISTIEHFDQNGFEAKPSDIIDPIEYLKAIVNTAKKYLVTFPLGYNNRLTSFIIHQYEFDVKFLARYELDWKLTDKNELRSDHLDYNMHTWYANSIAIVENFI